MSHPPQEPVSQGRALLSKRRFREISDALRAEFSDAAAVERVLDRIREIMRFDERVTTYTPQQRESSLRYAAKHVRVYVPREAAPPAAAATASGSRVFSGEEE